MNFEKYSPILLRDCIEYELQTTDDSKTATIRALKNLKKNPDHYAQFGILEREPMEKAKYLKKWRGSDGKMRYKYKDDENNIKNGNIEKIKLKMRFDANSLFFNFNAIGFEKRIGNEKTSKESLDTTKEIEDNIKNFDKEYTSVINKNGEILFSKVGNYDEISFNDIEINKLRNSEILTHTHPKDKSFSAEDAFLALSLGIKELRVKTPENTYFFKISHKKNIDEQELNYNNRTFMAVLINTNNSMIDLMRNKIANKEKTVKEAEKEHRELLWQSIAKSHLLSDAFNIEYGKVEK